jgi:hypothetical protein
MMIKLHQRTFISFNKCNIAFLSGPKKISFRLVQNNEPPTVCCYYQANMYCIGPFEFLEASDCTIFFGEATSCLPFLALAKSIKKTLKIFQTLLLQFKVLNKIKIRPL